MILVGKNNEVNWMKKIQISIFGSCISRDTFDFDTENLFDIKTYINFSSIISQMSESPFASFRVVEHKSKWYSKIISSDINKNAIDLLSEDKSQFIIIDLMGERLQLLKVKGYGGKDSFLTLHNDLMQTDLVLAGGV